MAKAYHKRCLGCGDIFATPLMHASYCLSCRQCAYQNIDSVRATQYITPVTKGAIGELVVATDLLRKGYEVFRAMSANCSCDLIAKDGDELIPIEVRTTRRQRNGELYPCDKNVHVEQMALYVPNEKRIVYAPALPDTSETIANLQKIHDDNGL